MSEIFDIDQIPEVTFPITVNNIPILMERPLTNG